MKGPYLRPEPHPIDFDDRPPSRKGLAIVGLGVLLGGGYLMFTHNVADPGGKPIAGLGGIVAGGMMIVRAYWERIR